MEAVRGQGKDSAFEPYRRPETLPLSLHALRLRQYRAEQEEHSQRLAAMCAEVTVLRRRHEELVAQCIHRDLLSPELRDAILQAAMKGASD
jgi:hypothetical protein